MCHACVCHRPNFSSSRRNSHFVSGQEALKVTHMAAAAPAAPGIGGAPPAPAPPAFNPHTKREKPPLLTDQDSFEFWSESFRLLCDRSGNLQWTLAFDPIRRAQLANLLGLSPVQQYAAQEEMWSLLHDACKHVELAIPILSHMSRNKGRPEFATEAWIEICKAFDPRDAPSLLRKKSILKTAISSFKGEYRTWLQGILHRYAILRDAGQQIPEDKIVKKIKKAVYKWACQGTTLRHEM